MKTNTVLFQEPNSLVFQLFDTDAKLLRKLVLHLEV